MTPRLFRRQASIFYLLGYSNDNCIAIDFGLNEKALITDARYSEAAKSIGGFEVIESKDLIKAAAALFRKKKIKKALIDTTEWSAQEFLKLQKFAYLLQKPHFSAKLRSIKTEEEIQKIDAACRYGKNAFDNFAKQLKVGMSEKEAAFLMTNLMNCHGMQEISFDPIVAFGAGASIPHYEPSLKKLEQNTPILIDAGCKIDGYCSDMTRTALFTENTDFAYEQKFKNSLHQKIYDTALKAHDLAISKAKVGMKASELDKIARDEIKKAGFEKDFKHGLGHGVGLEIHEEPSISPRSNEILKEGMVFTIEPGIYIEGEFGVRIEDVVVLRTNGAEILGRT